VAVESVSDADLWSAGRAGDGAAFAQLMDRHSRKIYNYCFRRTADWAAAEDLVSATFLEAWRRRDLQVADGALPVLLGIATNLMRNHHRSLRRLSAALPRLASRDVVPDFADDVAQRLDDEAAMAKVLEAAKHLRHAERDVLALVVWSELSMADTARALGMPVGTVKSTLARARTKLAAAAEPARGYGHDMGGRLKAAPADRT
jgi:RNA polymerase sigma factor (sigma-70 family)